MHFIKLVGCLSIFSLVGCSTFSGSSDVLSNSELQNHVAAHATEINAIKPKVEQLEIKQVSFQSDLDLFSQELAKLKRTSSQNMTTNSAEMQTTSTGSGQMKDASIGSDDSSMVDSFSGRSDPVIADFKAGRDAAKNSSPLSQEMPLDKYYGVQLAAYASKPLAMKGWREISRANPIDYVDTAPLIKRHSIKGKVYYQLKVGPFLERSYSVDFCNMLKQQRSQPCLITLYDGEPFLSP